MQNRDEPVEYAATDIAIVGMAGRFPGAASVRELWANLREGVESIVPLTDEELAAEGLDPSTLRGPEYVRAWGVLDGIDQFDAPFFGFNAREADVTDPQHRVFLECVWEALEAAGYPPGTHRMPVGVFAGAGHNNYLGNLRSNPGLLALVGMAQARIGNAPDHLTTRVAYKLDLHGPAITVQTTCSTSLVAVHVACQSLLNLECDLAVAGGVSINVPHRIGYPYQEQGIFSPDGHCRAFDERARGTVGGAGAGVVVLRRMADALEAGDTILAIIRGSAVNNDGSDKVGYTAPSAAGQARVITEALTLAAVDPDTVGYVEAHGTGTQLGDPIEVSALTEVFRNSTDRVAFCGLGSVKTAVGHLDAAAGVAGLIKTVLALRSGVIPPSLHFERPNPALKLDRSPFFVPTRAEPWPRGDTPRRAGVSSFGIGGTNAHVVLEEAPPVPAAAEEERTELLVLSARTATALDAARARLAAHLAEAQEGPQPLADVAFTLRVGRAPFPHRLAVVAASAAEAAARLADPAYVVRGVAGDETRPVAFLFPGQGAQYPGMAAGIYRSERVFREVVDHCAERLRPILGHDLRTLLFADGADAAERLRRTGAAQPALYVIEYALARLWEHRGVRPAAMLGHSIGEYVAATLAGVFTLDAALELVAERGRLMQALPPGAMLAVPLAESAVAELLAQGVDGAASGELSLAAVNAPEHVVVSGPHEAVAALERALAAQGIAARPLHTSHAFHSAMMEPALEPFAAAVERAHPRAPERPFISNLTGTWITPAQAVDPRYWARHLREPVRFADGVAALWKSDPRLILLEVGPGDVLGKLARRQAPRGKDAAAPVILASLPSPPAEGEAPADDVRALLEAAGGIWTAGGALDWSALHAPGPRRRVPLPTYPFERRRHWIEPARERTGPSTAQPRSEPASADPAPVAEAAADPAPETTMSAPTEHAAPEPRVDRLARGLSEIFGQLLGIPAEELDRSASFLVLGADSLLLMQASRAIEVRLGIPVPFRTLMGGAPTVDALAAHLDAELPPEAPAAPAAPSPSIETSSPPALPTAESTVADGADSPLERILARQLEVMRELMANQLEVLRGNASPSASTPSASPSAPAPSANGAAQPRSRAAADTATPAAVPPAAEEPRAFGPHRPVQTGAGAALTPQQKQHLDALIERYTARTRESKRLTDAYRPVLADNRVPAGFRMQWKEMIYTLVGARSEGSRLWDVDGNEYVDYTMGFGVHLFGHSPEFVVRAIEEQMRRGSHIGPQSERAGEVAELIARFTGMERVTFCNTGSEAVTTAMRIARTVTGRSKIVMFAGSYHGGFDSTLAVAGGGGQPVPVAPGIPPGLVGDLVILEYGDPAALEEIRARAGELAAVLVEPIQSRRPDYQPHEFVAELRRITEEAGVALIFDEVITGFRLHPGGAQAMYGVRADLATYGKVLGGGLPIGLVAGSARWMDAIDGGVWRFGDASHPHAKQTFFAGTFSKHPLAMAAALAVLRHLEQEGPALQEGLNRRAEALVGRLNALFAEMRAPLTVVGCGSMFRFGYGTGSRYAELFFYHLLENGIYVWEGRGCFLSTAHTDEDNDRFVAAARRSLEQLREGGFLPGAPGGGGERVVPLTPPQRQIWVHAQLGEETSLAYNQFAAVPLPGTLGEDAVRAALRALAARHDALRLEMLPDGGGQRILPALEPEAPLHDLSGREDAEREIARLRQEEARTPFDLSRAPLWRARIVRLDAERQVVLLTIHHIIADAVSINLLRQELRELAAAAAEGRPPQLSPAMQFGDYAARQAEAADGAEMRRAADYWRVRLADVPPLQLPADRPRGAPGRSLGGRESVWIEAPARDALKRLAAHEGTTFFAAILAGFAALLHRVSGQDDLLVGVPTLGRAMDGDEGMVGHFVDLIPFRSRAPGDPTVAQLLRDAGAAWLDAQENRVFTLGHWLASDDAAAPPRVDVTFNLEPGAANRRRPAGGDTEAVTYAKFDLGLNVVDGADGLEVLCDYAAQRFDAPTVRRLLEAFARVLESMPADPERRMSDLPLLSGEERRIVLEEWNATAAELPGPRTLYAMFTAQARRTPDAIALAEAGRELTYAEVEDRSARLARRLRARGVGPETVVGLLVEPGIDAIVAMLGVLRAGGAWLPLNPAAPDERIGWMLRDADARRVVADEALRSRVPAGIDAVTTGALEDEADAELPDVSPESLAYVIYTSGSTGTPKGVGVEHRGIANLVAAQIRTFGAGPGERILQLAPLSFDASVAEIFIALCSGAALHFPAARIPGPELVREIRERGITCFKLPPSALAALPDDPLPGVRTLLVGGEACPPELARRWAAGRRLFNVYGPTEAAVRVTTAEVAPDAAVPPIGRPLANTRVYALDAHGQPVPVGVPGELYAAGVQVARGYLGRPGLTAERFLPDPFGGEPGGRMYRTGDRVRWRADGELEFLGRTDEQVKVRGFRVEPGEVEAALAAHPAVREAAVVAREEGPGDVRLVAYVVAADGEAAEPRALREHLRARLPEYMVPGDVVVLDALPLTAHGKLDRAALPAPQRQVGDDAPRTPTEEAVAAIWAEVLRLPRVGIHDSFFELGGHSLLATRVAARIRQSLGVEVSLPDLFEHPTVAALAERVDAGRGDAGAEREIRPRAEEEREDDAFLAGLEALSDDDLRALLAVEGEGE